MSLVPDITCGHIRLFLGVDKSEGVETAIGLLKVYERTVEKQQVNSAINEESIKTIDEQIKKLKPKVKSKSLPKSDEVR